MTKIRALALAALLAAMATPAFAQQFTAGDITVETPWMRATPKGADVAAGYLTIRNAGAAADRLVSGSADFAGAVEVHKMTMTNGVMTMRLVADGMEIPAKGAVTLSPNSYHLMFKGLKQPIVAGETLKATLTFEHAGALALEFKVSKIGAMSPSGTGGSMGGMKMD
ncbi:MAG TPA: copper chaperone PCu(A)C [Roseiarcus sp.]|nr:copper chaperone PCu(A)C [Roseiarcus sp.]